MENLAKTAAADSQLDLGEAAATMHDVLHSKAMKSSLGTESKLLSHRSSTLSRSPCAHCCSALQTQSSYGTFRLLLRTRISKCSQPSPPALYCLGEASFA